MISIERLMCVRWSFLGGVLRKVLVIFSSGSPAPPPPAQIVDLEGNRCYVELLKYWLKHATSQDGLLALGASRRRLELLRHRERCQRNRANAAQSSLDPVCCPAPLRFSRDETVH